MLDERAADPVNGIAGEASMNPVEVHTLFQDLFWRMTFSVTDRSIPHTFIQAVAEFVTGMASVNHPRWMQIKNNELVDGGPERWQDRPLVVFKVPSSIAKAERACRALENDWSMLRRPGRPRKQNLTPQEARLLTLIESIRDEYSDERGQMQWARLFAEQGREIRAIVPDKPIRSPNALRVLVERSRKRK